MHPLPLRSMKVKAFLAEPASSIIFLRQTALLNSFSCASSSLSRACLDFPRLFKYSSASFRFGSSTSSLSSADGNIVDSKGFLAASCGGAFGGDLGGEADDDDGAAPAARFCRPRRARSSSSRSSSSRSTSTRSSATSVTSAGSSTGGAAFSSETDISPGDSRPDTLLDLRNCEGDSTDSSGSSAPTPQPAEGPPPEGLLGAEGCSALDFNVLSSSRNLSIFLVTCAARFLWCRCSSR
mmetsp:Transcript_36357/g.94023  ORF Transcript_36357/g.94023 Transcript_36357/m.94023 type:complete len:238 (-) Transcript_36357:406-1119(-)